MFHSSELHSCLKLYSHAIIEWCRRSCVLFTIHCDISYFDLLFHTYSVTYFLRFHGLRNKKVLDLENDHTVLLQYPRKVKGRCRSQNSNLPTRRRSRFFLWLIHIVYTRKNPLNPLKSIQCHLSFVNHLVCNTHWDSPLHPSKPQHWMPY